MHFDDDIKLVPIVRSVMNNKKINVYMHIYNIRCRHAYKNHIKLLAFIKNFLIK